MSASVKVMRSYDYCHFEICLGSEEIDPYSDENAIAAVDKMRKEAMRLADKAVSQYQIAKRTREYPITNEWEYNQLQKQAEEIKKNFPESEQTPEQKAILKEYEDMTFRINIKYDYEDDWEW